MRFERGESGGGAQLDVHIGSPSEYLAKLWTLFGRPDDVVDGLVMYFVHDRDTGHDFEVYVTAAGIIYAGPIGSDEALAPVIVAFDALLATTPLADYTFEMRVGEGTTVRGAKNGVAFERHEQPPPPTPAQAVARAEETLAADYPDPMVYYVAMLELHEVSPDARDVLAKLWHRAFAAAIAKLEAERAKGDAANHNTVYLALGALRMLDKNAGMAGVDAAAARAPHLATIRAFKE